MKGQIAGVEAATKALRQSVDTLQESLDGLRKVVDQSQALQKESDELQKLIAQKQIGILDLGKRFPTATDLAGIASISAEISTLSSELSVLHERLAEIRQRQAELAEELAAELKKEAEQYDLSKPQAPSHGSAPNPP
jgi:predicted  nucleic acid-binding Zn-ribbon protein